VTTPDAPLFLDGLSEVDLDGSSSERDTHPVVDRADDGRWVAAWDAGTDGLERVLVRWLAEDGTPLDDAALLALGAPGAGFLTPDVQIDGDVWFGVVRCVTTSSS
jgi:hypothetical protein